MLLIKLLKLNVVLRGRVHNPAFILTNSTTIIVMPYWSISYALFTTALINFLYEQYLTNLKLQGKRSITIYGYFRVVRRIQLALMPLCNWDTLLQRAAKTRRICPC
ncbi:hypothetical protein CXF93_11995 [Moritella sp. Urea-trap-13]|nr:hypothetical protein CXF93_11995 [Moritella sp. Urea-trap-13]